MLWEPGSLYQELLGKEKHGGLHIYVVWNKNWGREEAHELSLLAEELLAGDGFWGKQSQFCLCFCLLF